MMPEQRLDRLERLAKLFVKEGRRFRREQREKTNMLIDAQIRNEDAQTRNEEKFARTEERFAILAESQTHTDRRLDALIDIIRQGRNDGSLE